MMLVLCMIFLGLTALYDRFVSVFVVMLQGSSYGHYEVADNEYEWNERDENWCLDFAVIACVLLSKTTS